MNRVSITGKVETIQVQKSRYDTSKVEGSLLWVSPTDNSMGYQGLPVWVPQELRDQGLDKLAEKQVITVDGRLGQVYVNNAYMYVTYLDNVHVHKPYREGKVINDQFSNYVRQKMHAAANADGWRKQAEERHNDLVQVKSRLALVEQELRTKDEKLKAEILRVTTGM